MNHSEPLTIQPNVYYTVDEVARLLRVSRQSVLRLLRSGQAGGIKIGRQWRVLGTALLNLSGQRLESETQMVADWLFPSAKSLQEVWDNEEDAVYDNF